MAPWAVRVEGGVGSYRWFVYITTSLWREASWLLYCIVGHPNPASALSILLVLLEPHCIKYEVNWMIMNRNGAKISCGVFVSIGNTLRLVRTVHWIALRNAKCITHIPIIVHSKENAC